MTSFVSAEQVCFPDEPKLCEDAIESNDGFYCNTEDVKLCDVCKVNQDGDDYCIDSNNNFRNANLILFSLILISGLIVLIFRNKFNKV